MKTRITSFMITIVLLMLLTAPTALAQIEWMKHTIDGSFNYAEAVHAADVDGDADMDVLGAAYLAHDITWWENDGNENFTEHTIDGNFYGARDIQAVDLDDDGDVDVLGAAGIGDEIAWWRNDGNENFEKITLWESFDGAVSVCAANIYPGALLDVVGAGSIEGTIRTMVQVSPGVFEPSWIVAGNFAGVRSVYAEDINGDYVVDILGAAYLDDEIAWWRFTGNPFAPFYEYIIDANFDGAESVFAEDVDGDGDMDVLGAAVYDNDITWWENDGNENFTEHTIDGNYDGAIDVYTEDVDGDGYLDVLGAANLAHDITWWEQVYPPTVSASALDYDQVLVSSASSLPLTIYGNTFETVYLTDVYTDDPVFTTDFNPADSLLAAGDSLQITVTFLPDSVTTYSGTLHIENSEKLLTVSLSGEGLLPFSLSADSLVFEGTPAGFQDTMPLTIYNIGSVTRLITSITSDEPVFTTDFDPADSLLASGDSLEITVTFSPDEVLLYEGTLTIESDVVPFTASLSGEGIDPVIVTLTPSNPPIIIPETGGSFDFNIALENQAPAAQTIDFWTEVELPEYGSVEILSINGINLTAGAIIDRDRTQNVPEFAPAGIYTYNAYVGDRSQWQVDHYDSFTFEKEGSTDGVLGTSADWFCSGEGFEELQTAPEMAIPTEFVMHGAYPNPFNPTTTFSFALPEASQVMLNVYNLNGQMVQTVIDGMRGVGSHSVTYDASHLSSGVYLYQITAGEYSASGKMVLMK
jgi:hypothetical protein